MRPSKEYPPPPSVCTYPHLAHPPPPNNILYRVTAQSCKRSGGDADADDLDATVVWGREAATANIHRRREIEM